MAVEKPFVIGRYDSSEEAGNPEVQLRDLFVFKDLLTDVESEALALRYPEEHIQPSLELSEAIDGTDFDAAAVMDKLEASRNAKLELTRLVNTTPTTLIMEEKQDSEPFAHVLVRGDYASPGERVTAGVPEAFPPLPEGEKANRLALAKWLINPENPLPARVTVNRYWQELFGTGIVKTSEDFGSQGEPPSHIELLDWLASEFVASDWNIKHIYKVMLMSGTYRQASIVTEKKYTVDPENRLLARGPRYRYDAEVIRDQALYVSGLMVEQAGGPPVKPYQPAGVWEAVGYTNSNTANFVRDDGDKLYRRSLYTFWKRTAPPPSMAIFDAPTRESCSVRRERTNTPLQALVLMNDPQFVEAARHLALNVLQEPTDDKFTALYSKAMGREPSPETREIMQRTHDKILPIYQEDIDAARKLLSIGTSPIDESVDVAELATWTMLANQVMNPDAHITKN